MIRLKVQEIAEAHGISKSLLQRKSGVTMPTLRAYWNNDVQSVHLVSLERIAHALGVKAVELIEELPDQEDAA